MGRCFIDDGGGRAAPLWAGPPLGRWAWVCNKEDCTNDEEFLHGFCFSFCFQVPALSAFDDGKCEVK